MSPDRVPAKSLMGLEEIESRQRRLPPRLRATLVMVDGQRTAGELAASAGALGEAVAARLEKLQRLGYVIDASRPPPPLDVRTVTLLKIQLGDLLHETPALDATALRLALQRCRTTNDLLRWVDWALPRMPGGEESDLASTFQRRARQLVAAMIPAPEPAGEFPNLLGR
jgi:hypothetical protein